MLPGHWKTEQEKDAPREGCVLKVVEASRLELLTLCLQSRCSPN